MESAIALAHKTRAIANLSSPLEEADIYEALAYAAWRAATRFGEVGQMRSLTNLDNLPSACPVRHLLIW